MSLSTTESPEERMVFSASLLIELLISFFPAPHPSTAGARAWIHGPDMCGEYDLSGVWGFKCLEAKKKKKRLSGFRLSLPLTPQPVTDEFELQEQDVWGPRLWCRAVTPFHCHLPVLLILSEIQNGSTAGPVLVWSVEEPKRQIAARLADCV